MVVLKFDSRLMSEGAGLATHPAGNYMFLILCASPDAWDRTATSVSAIVNDEIDPISGYTVRPYAQMPSSPTWDDANKRARLEAAISITAGASAIAYRKAVLIISSSTNPESLSDTSGELFGFFDDGNSKLINANQTFSFPIGINYLNPSSNNGQ